FNLVWEDWSRVEHFRMVPEGDLEFGPIERDLEPFYQQKGYEDTFSFRLGGSYAVNDWLTASAGGAYETAAQPDEYTTLDFASWERFAPGIGATLRPHDDWEIDLGYSHIFMPSRYVQDGEIRNHVPLSDCQGPDYDDDACDEEGVPPGSPQNNGYWQASFQYLSVGVTYRYR
ncbi:MAG: OmpP1/FadL family transporter, partial [Persicimonas sp.]